jgi:hypothetical protein
MFGDHTMDIKPSSFWCSSKYYFESFGWSYLFLSQKIFEFDSIFVLFVVVHLNLNSFFKRAI